MLWAVWLDVPGADGQPHACVRWVGVSEEAARDVARFFGGDGAAVHVGPMLGPAWSCELDVLDGARQAAATWPATVVVQHEAYVSAVAGTLLCYAGWCGHCVSRMAAEVALATAAGRVDA